LSLHDALPISLRAASCCNAQSAKAFAEERIGQLFTNTWPSFPQRHGEKPLINQRGFWPSFPKTNIARSSVQVAGKSAPAPDKNSSGTGAQSMLLREIGRAHV